MAISERDELETRAVLGKLPPDHTPLGRLTRFLIGAAIGSLFAGALWFILSVALDVSRRGELHVWLGLESTRPLWLAVFAAGIFLGAICAMFGDRVLLRILLQMKSD